MKQFSERQSGFLERSGAAGLFLGLLLGGAIASVLFAIISAGGSDAPKAGARVLKMAHALDPTHPVHLAMEWMADDLFERSGGQLQIMVYPSGQLGAESDSIEQVQQGALAMVKTSTATMEQFVPEMALFGLPYLFRDEEHYWNVLRGEIGQELLESGVNQGMRGLVYYDSGSRSFYTIDAPILSPEDLKGEKIRVLRSKMAMDMISQLGGSPTPIPWGELYTALQQGMVDGAENNAPSYYTSRHFEVAKHFSLDEHTRVPDIVLFSEQIWQSLSPVEQRWVRESAEASVAYQRQVWDEQSAEAMEALQKAGVTVYYPDKEPFRQKVQPLYDRFEGTPLGKLVERVRAHP
jgi:tripartite ATP-independent transporter DctP family solute receptor